MTYRPMELIILIRLSDGRTVANAWQLWCAEKLYILSFTSFSEKSPLWNTEKGCNVAGDTSGSVVAMFLIVPIPNGICVGIGGGMGTVSMFTVTRSSPYDACTAFVVLVGDLVVVVGSTIPITPGVNRTSTPIFQTCCPL